MKQTFMVVILLLAAHLTTPFWWWIVAIPLAVHGFWRTRPGKAFLSGAAGGGLVWFAVSLILFLSGGGIIAGRMAKLFFVGSSWLMPILTGLIAAIAAGIAGLAGAWFGDAVRLKKIKS